MVFLQSISIISFWKEIYVFLQSDDSSIAKNFHNSFLHTDRNKNLLTFLASSYQCSFSSWANCRRTIWIFGQLHWLQCQVWVLPATSVWLHHVLYSWYVLEYFFFSMLQAWVSSGDLRFLNVWLFMFFWIFRIFFCFFFLSNSKEKSAFNFFFPFVQ